MTVARFTVRPTKGGRGDLILGAMFKHQGDTIKPGRIYELREILETIVLVDIGPAAISDDPKTSYTREVSWGNDVNYILDMGSGHLLTVGEAAHRIVD